LMRVTAMVRRPEHRCAASSGSDMLRTRRSTSAALRARRMGDDVRALVSARLSAGGWVGGSHRQIVPLCLQS
jgi:hypothetical protein